MSKMGVQKISKKQSAKKSSTLPKWSQIGAPGNHQSSTKFQLFRNFLHPGPEMGPESSRGPKKVAQGVQKVPKGFQKVAKSHEKAIHKAPTRRPNAMRKQQSNQATKQRRNEATKQQSNKATKQPSNQATKQQSNKATKAPSHPGTQARWREGRRQMDNIIRHSSASVDVVHYVVRKIVCSVGGATCVWPPSHWMFQTSTSCTHSLTRSITTGLWFCPVCPGTMLSSLM